MTMVAHPALVLNADFRPMSYFPLSLLSWQDAVTPCSASASRSWPSTTRGRAARPRRFGCRPWWRCASTSAPPRRVAFTRFNVFLRDRFTCQYCGEAFASSALTFEHVIPRSRGGQTTWSNIVTACVPVQHGQGQLAAHQAAARAEGADAQRAAGCQARVSARLSARELGGLPLLGRAARGLASSRSSVDQSTAVRRRRSRVQVAPRRPTRKVPLEWPATRLENGWAPQGVAFEPSAFRQHGCGRSHDRPPPAHAQILKRQRGLTVNQVPSGFAGSSPALCTSVRSSMAEPCVAHAQTWVRFPSAAPIVFAWEANLVKAPR